MWLANTLPDQTKEAPTLTEALTQIPVQLREWLGLDQQGRLAGVGEAKVCKQTVLYSLLCWAADKSKWHNFVRKALWHDSKPWAPKQKGTEYSCKFGMAPPSSKLVLCYQDRGGISVAFVLRQTHINH